MKKILLSLLCFFALGASGNLSERSKSTIAAMIKIEKANLQEAKRNKRDKKHIKNIKSRISKLNKAYKAKEKKLNTVNKGRADLSKGTEYTTMPVDVQPGYRSKRPMP